MSNKKTYYYKSYNEDVVKSKNQDYKLKENYKWEHNSFLYNCVSKIIYFIAYIVGKFYCRFGLHIKIVNREKLKEVKKEGYFLYANHTQMIGDVFIPAICCFPKKVNVLISTANMGIPVIGKMLPILGGIPIPNTIKQMKEMSDCIYKRIEENKCVVIYPEAHVWPYYTKIRTFEESAFKFVAKSNSPSFCITTTYYKRKFFKKPGIKIFVDGPFFIDENLSLNEKKKKICKEIYEVMNERSKNSTYEFVEYKQVMD